MERIPGGTRQNDGLETGIMGATAAPLAWIYLRVVEHVVDGAELDEARALEPASRQHTATTRGGGGQRGAGCRVRVLRLLEECCPGRAG